MRSESILLHSTTIEYEKSTFFVEMLEHTNGQEYVTIEQIVHLDNDNHHSKTIRINPVALDKIILVLIEMRTKLSARKGEKVFNEKDQQEIVRRYLKGVDIKDLMLQFDGDEKAISKALLMNNVEIVSQDVPKYNAKRWRKRSK